MTFCNFRYLFVILLSLIIQIYNLEQTDNNYDNKVFNELLNSPQFEFQSETEDNEDVILKDHFDFSWFNGNECLLPNDEAKNILSKNGINGISPDQNIRFILGKCSPVLLIPGIYATKLRAEFNCKKIANKERDTTLKNLRIYCGKTICEDETKESEEHAVFISIFDTVTGIGPFGDKYSSCLGFLMNFYQDRNECPKVNNKNICYYSKYINIAYYGGTASTKDKAKCGLEAIENLIQIDYPFDIGNRINPSKTESFYSITDRLLKRGYEEGFSIAGLPSDYRRYLGTNNFTKNVFRYQIEKLYNNTGKSVVIIAHSFGSLLTLTNLLRNENKDLIPKIKKFVAIGPPFAGATKLAEIFFFGDEDMESKFHLLGYEFNKINFNYFGQFLIYKSLPTIAELRPLPIAARIFTDPIYSELGEAVRKRIDIENSCMKSKCRKGELQLTEKFDNIFKGYFPSLLDSECDYEDKIGGNKETLNRKCYTGIYNVGECPTIILNNSLTEIDEDKLDLESNCYKYESNYYYQGDCNNNNKNKQCLDNLYSEKIPDVFGFQDAMDYIISRFNSENEEDFQQITLEDFEPYESIQEGVKKLISRQKETSLIEDLPIPPVDTDLVYSSFYPTTASLIVDENFNEAYIMNKGGDGTVPSWSSLLTGLKWIYDKKRNPNMKQNIRLIEYCSRLSESGQYKYDPNEEQKFAALGCSCLNNNQYKNTISDCSHPNMITDSILIDYLVSIVDDPKEKPVFTKAQNEAIRNYDPNLNYEEQCNDKLFSLFSSENN